MCPHALIADVHPQSKPYQSSTTPLTLPSHYTCRHLFCCPTLPHSFTNTRKLTRRWGLYQAPFLKTFATFTASLLTPFSHSWHFRHTTWLLAWSMPLVGMTWQTCPQWAQLSLARRAQTPPPYPQGQWTWVSMDRGRERMIQRWVFLSCQNPGGWAHPLGAKEHSHSLRNPSKVIQIFKDKYPVGVYEHSDASYHSHWFYIEKKSRALRLIHNLQPLNTITIRSSGVPPITNQVIEAMAGHSCYLMLNLFVGYNHRTLNIASLWLDHHPIPHRCDETNMSATGMDECQCHLP